MTRDDILNYIDNLTIYDKDYDLFINLMNNTSPKLFSKIMEEIARGNIYITDFESLLPTESLSKLNDSIESQAELSEKLQRISNFRKGLNNTENLQVAFTNENNKKFIERDEITDNLYNYLKPYQYSGSERDLRIKLIEKAIANPDSIVLSPNDYIVSIQYDDIKLTDDDLSFMRENNLNESDIKKIKSLTLYLLNNKNS